MNEDEYDENLVGYQVGAYQRSSPYDGLSDEQAEKLQAELEEHERRKIPLGFRS